MDIGQQAYLLLLRLTTLNVLDTLIVCSRAI